MQTRPRISLCIPSYNRAAYLKGALESGLQEAANQPPGTVEVLVCDNASTDETWDLISRIQIAHPHLRALRNSENLGFDRNYLSCLNEARGEFIWVMGDDDIWLPGSLGRVLLELDAGADACLCLAEACDLDLNPLIVLPWYLDNNPPAVWLLENRDDLIRYFNACARNAGAFAFISVAIFRRDRFLQNWASLQRAEDIGYTQVWGMMEFLLQPTRLHYIPEALVRNRMSDTHSNSVASQDLYERWMIDLRGWLRVADGVFGDDPELCEAFSRILGRNHHDTILPGLRKSASSEERWQAAVPYLIRAGFTPLQVAAMDFAFQHMKGEHPPAPSLNPDTLCFADLAMITRGARLSAVLALGELQDLLNGAGLLAALRSQMGADRVLVFCRPETAGLFTGFEVIPIDGHRYHSEESYRELLASALKGEPIDLVVNLDPQRAIEADDLCAIMRPVGAIAFQLPERGQSPELVKALNEAYTCLLPTEAGVDGLRQALDLPPAEPALWPAEAAQQEARNLLAQQGWEPAKTMAVLLDHPSIAQEPAFQTAFADALASGWTFVGIGGRGSRSLLAGLCGPLEERAVNLAGMLGLGAMAAVLQHCSAFIGGTPLVQAMAQACGCKAYGGLP